MSRSELRAIQDRVVRKLGMLVHCARILDHNRDDADFRRRDGQIYYVLDTNVCQAFLEPLPNAQFTELFHSPRWDQHSGVDAFNAQTAMLACEFIFSSHLKSANDKLYMSGPHLAELHTQVTILRNRLMRLSRDAGATAAAQRYIEEIDAASRLRTQRPSHLIETIGKDITEMWSGPGARAPTEKEFSTALDSYVMRAICRFLAQEDRFEPTEQLTRFFSPGFGQRIQTLEMLFPIDEEEEVSIQALQKDWDDALKRELRFRLATMSSEQDRRKEEADRTGSIAADARTLAHLQWATSHRLQQRERAVFITGDRLILNAYRRWYAKSHGTSFLVRPIALYAPQFNLQDASAKHSRAAGVFEATRTVLEGVILRANFALMNEQRKRRLSRAADPFTATRARDQFCLDAEYGDPIDPDFLEDLFGMAGNPDSLRNEEHRLDMIASLMRNVEQISVGALPHLVRDRVEQASQRARKLSDLLRSLADPSDIIGRWVEERLDHALKSELVFAAPLAAHQVKVLASHRSPTPRAEIDLYLRFPIQGELLTTHEYVRELKKHEDPGPLMKDIADAPALVFALASWLAFRHHLWSDAIRYAEFASIAARNRLDEPDAGEDERAEEHFFECKYLKAISLRYRMASTAPDPARDDSDLWQRWLQSAEQELNECIEHHNKQRGQRVQELRALSERAAVRLVYCAWATLGKLRDLPVYKRVSMRVGPTLLSAATDLNFCYSELTAALAEADKDTPHRKELRTLALHVGINAEPARLLYDILREQGLVEVMPAVDQALKPIEWPQLGKNSSPIVEAYELSARARRGEDVTDEARALGADHDLAQDTTIIKAIAARLGQKAK